MRTKIFFLFLLLLFACSEEKIQPQLEKSTPDGEIPSHESWNSKIMFTEDGKIKAILFSDHLKKYELKKVTFLENIKIDFMTKNRKILPNLPLSQEE